jgi:hypothetical protein
MKRNKNGSKGLGLKRAAGVGSPSQTIEVLDKKTGKKNYLSFNE